MKRILIPTSSGSDWQAPLAKPKQHWKSGRSAMSAAACWETHHPDLPKDIADVLQQTGDESLVDLELLAAIPEWEVDLPISDRPSQTDILALTRNKSGLVVLGVEAKVEEPFGPTLGEKRNGSSSGQLERIAYLETQIGCLEPMADHIRYQLLHRTVSALLTVRAFHAPIAVMLVQSFSQVSKWRDDFEAFARDLSARQLSADMYELNVDHNTRLLIGWCTGGEEFLHAELPSKF